ncbi:MAG: hypothetical protein QF872_06635, partial [Gammaproteobacteria bacterium]|nr:hypothetical protein [Gammaproteobacteria bacterium]
LSRELAAAGHYPAIDIGDSVSRLAQVLQTDSQKIANQLIRSWLSSYKENRDLITVGAYQVGQNRVLDESIQKKQDMDRFLQQGIHEPCDMATSVDHLQLLAQPPQHELQSSETIQG